MNFDLAEVRLEDVLRQMAREKRSGVIQLSTESGGEGKIWLHSGNVVDVQAGYRQGEQALVRLLMWRAGQARTDIRSVVQRDLIGRPVEALLTRCMRAVAEWQRLVARLPPPDVALAVAYDELRVRLADIPDEYNSLLRLCAARHSLDQVLEQAKEFDDLEALRALAELYFKGVIYALPEDAKPIAKKKNKNATGGAVSEKPRDEELHQAVAESIRVPEDVGPRLTSDGGWMDLDLLVAQKLVSDENIEAVRQNAPNKNTDPKTDAPIDADEELDVWLGQRKK